MSLPHRAHRAHRAEPVAPADPGRRRLLGGAWRAFLTGLSIWISTLLPQRAWAAWPAPLFAPRSLAEALAAILGGAPAASGSTSPNTSPNANGRPSANGLPTSADFTLDLPAVAEDGAMVPVRIHCGLSGVRGVYLLAEKNRVPVLGYFPWHPRLRGPLALRIKLAETSRVVALAETGQGFFQAVGRIEVLQGGCG